MNVDELARFWTKVLKTETCWLWTASRSNRGLGYGQFGVRVEGRPRMAAAHRLSWELHHGPVPTGLCVCHRCDVKTCVNPEHLFIGTPSENIADKISKGRGRAARGEVSGKAKLSASDVDEVRRMLAAGATNRAVADHFGVSTTAVQHIRVGNAWAWHESPVQAPRPGKLGNSIRCPVTGRWVPHSDAAGVHR